MLKNKEVKNQDLLVVLKEMRDGFKKVDKRFDAVDKRFDIVDKRLDEHDNKFASTDRRLDKMAFEIVNIKEEMKDMVKKNDMIKFKDEILSAIDNITKKHDDHASEHIANLGAHACMQNDINECRKKLGLKINRQV